MSYDISPHWGSHSTLLESALSALPSGALVIEHGAGIYSTPIVARYDVRVLCVEDEPGWRSWAAWMYKNAGRTATVLERAKQTVGQLSASGLVFIDGITRERGDLLKWALDAKAPAIIAHDTEEDMAKAYGFHRHLMSVPGYVVTHDGERPRTTMWKRIAASADVE